MSTVVGDIHAAIKSTCQTALGATYIELQKVFDPSQANLRNIGSAFAIRHGDASTNQSIVKHYTLDHNFELLLVKRAEGRDNDSGIQDVINELYGKAHDCMTAMYATKLGLASTVLLVDEPRFERPEFLSNGAAFLQMSFVVKYRVSVP